MRQNLLRILWFLLLAVLLYFAIRNAPLTEIWSTLRQLQLWQIGFLLVINAFVILLMTARWWIIVRAENPSIPFWPLVGYRLSVFGVSYFTPGPQVGGEPLQALYLQRNHRLTLARATSAVIMDKLLEFLVNFLLLGIGVWAAIRVGVISESGTSLTLSLIGLAGVLMWPAIHILLLYRRRYPIAAILRSQPFISTSNKGVRLIIVSERMAAAFCRRHLHTMLLAILVSTLALAGIALEYVLMIRFLGIQLSGVQIFAALTAMQLAFLMPLPGGLGALEASQVFAFSAFGINAASAIGVTLLIRARDLLVGGIGLLLAGRGVAK